MKQETNADAYRDSRWSAMRNIIVSIYQPSHLAGLIPAMESCIQRAATNLNDGEEVSFSDLAVSLSTDVIGQAAFGTDFGLSSPKKTPGDDNNNDMKEAKASSEFINMHIHSTTSLKMDLSGSLSTIVGMFVPLLLKPLRQALLKVPWSADREITRVNGELRRMMDGIVAARMAARDPAASSPHKDFLSVLLAAREKDASTRELLSPDYLSSLTYEHLLAGSATTAFTLSSVLYLVSKHPEVESKLLGEIDAFGPRDRVPTAEDLDNKFPYLDQARPPLHILTDYTSIMGVCRCSRRQ